MKEPFSARFVPGKTNRKKQFQRRAYRVMIVLLITNMLIALLLSLNFLGIPQKALNLGALNGPVRQPDLSGMPRKAVLQNDNVPLPVMLKSSDRSGVLIKSVLYRVEGGETLFSIAKKFQVSLERLMEINNMKDPKIVAGSFLKIEKAPSTPASL